MSTEILGSGSNRKALCTLKPCLNVLASSGWPICLLPLELGFSLGICCVTLVWTQAQRLGDIRSKTVSRALGVVGLFGTLGWIEFGFWLLEN